jgi:hypothetical protein
MSGSCGPTAALGHVSGHRGLRSSEFPGRHLLETPPALSPVGFVLMSLRLSVVDSDPDC